MLASGLRRYGGRHATQGGQGRKSPRADPDVWKGPAQRAEESVQPLLPGAYPR